MFLVNKLHVSLQWKGTRKKQWRRTGEGRGERTHAHQEEACVHGKTVEKLQF